MPARQIVRTVVKSCFPWWGKVAVKLALVKLPVKYSALHFLALAQHGGMEKPQWAWEIFHQHYDPAQFARKGNGYVMLEMGPGDSLFMALIARSLGASTSYHIDVGSYANPDRAIYRGMAQYLADRGLEVPDLAAAHSLHDVLQSCNAHYLTNGLQSLRSLPDASVDFVFSNTVLQHVRLDELPDTLANLRRVMREDGCAVHTVDLRDMMGQSLHHLKFSERVWESVWFRKAEFYTNRLRLSEFLQAFKDAGFDVDLIEHNRWKQLPVARKKLAPPYRNMPDEELLSSTVRVLARPRATSSEQAHSAEAVPVE